MLWRCEDVELLVPWELIISRQRCCFSFFFSFVLNVDRTSNNVRKFSRGLRFYCVNLVGILDVFCWNATLTCRCWRFLLIIRNFLNGIVPHILFWFLPCGGVGRSKTSCVKKVLECTVILLSQCLVWTCFRLCCNAGSSGQQCHLHSHTADLAA